MMKRVMNVKKGIGMLFMVLFVTVGAFSNTTSHFKEGMKFIQQKDLKSAAESFKKASKKDPKNASSYYNQGHCLFDLHRYGEAIYCFEKALKYDPKNTNCIKNLEVCYFKLEQPGYEPIHSGTMRSFFAFGANNWAYSAIGCSILFSIMLVLFKKRRTTNSKRILLVGATFFFIVGIGCTWFAYTTNHAFHNSDFAIVIDKSIPTYDAAGLKTNFPLAEGTRIQILPPTQKGKINAMLGNGQEVIIDGSGWLKL